MPEYVPEGALLPSGIDVDETAAYFGITESSQILMDLEKADRHSCLTIVLNKISDLLLTDTFDLDSGSNRLNVETGEIYYILTGPLGLLELTQNLQDFLGLNLEGNTNKPNISEEQFSSLEALLDPINILKIYAIGDATGGNKELAKYVSAFDEMIRAPEQNLENLIQIKMELTNVLIETKNMQMPKSISILKSSKEITPPKIITPLETNNIISKNYEINERKEPEDNKKVIAQPQLQKPQVLKPPTKINKQYFEATPLPKPNIENNQIIPEKKNMIDLEKETSNTENWIEKEKSDLSERKQNNIPKIAPKSKPISHNINTQNNEMINQQVKTQNNNTHPINLNSNQNLPKPIQKNINKNKFNPKLNEIIRTFPKGFICGDCGVSLSNSWRFCPLCGFNSLN